MKYQVRIVEVLSKIVEVEAANEYDALDLVESLYCEESIVLDSGDFDYVDYLINED
jgi:hypothetical protein